ncbi:hypothetical protein EC957_004194 [Mortierella hygrophila]|uniref:Uncharacterized protein n=1 Tax=Mortierella hygrophila TaxID=979708 RepID=A0A9P6FJU9_9FUNG|nr:hypothetical protein EC957_004194 [Mortierella hygrophila]
MPDDLEFASPLTATSMPTDFQSPKPKLPFGNIGGLDDAATAVVGLPSREKSGVGSLSTTKDSAWATGSIGGLSHPQFVRKDFNDDMNLGKAKMSQRLQEEGGGGVARQDLMQLDPQSALDIHSSPASYDIDAAINLCMDSFVFLVPIRVMKHRITGAATAAGQEEKLMQQQGSTYSIPSTTNLDDDDEDLYDPKFGIGYNGRRRLQNRNCSAVGGCGSVFSSTASSSRSSMIISSSAARLLSKVAGMVPSPVVISTAASSAVSDASDAKV